MKWNVPGMGVVLAVCVVCGSALAVPGVPHAPLAAVTGCSNYNGATPFTALQTPYGAPATATEAGSIPIFALTPTLDNPVTSWPSVGAYDFCAAFDTTACALGGIVAVLSEFSIPHTLFMCATDINGPLNTDPGAAQPFAANGIPDGEYELGLLAAILNSPATPHHAEVTAAFQANYDYFRQMVTAALANAPLKADLRNMVVNLCGPCMHTGLAMVLAGYATEGDSDTLAALDALIAGLAPLGFTPPANGIATVTTGLPAILGPAGDADADGWSNRAEYNYFKAQGAAVVIAAQLDPGSKEPITLPPPMPDPDGMYEVGSTLMLTAQVPNGVVVVAYAWYKDGVRLGATTPQLVIQKLALSDTGRYSCTITTDHGEVLSSLQTLVIVGLGPQKLTVTGGLGLALLAGACAFGGVRRGRLRENRRCCR